MNLSELYKALLKATGTDINTGTDDAKYVTPKAINDSTLKRKLNDVDGDTYIDVEETSDADTIVGKVGWTEVLRFHSSGILDLAKQSGCYMYLSSNQAYTKPNWQKVNLDAKLWDVQNEDDTTNSRITITEPGKYLIIGSVGLYVTGAGDHIQCGIYKNGSQADWSAFNTASDDTHTVKAFTILDLSASDYLELYARNPDQDDTIYGNVIATYLIAFKIG